MIHVDLTTEEKKKELYDLFLTFNTKKEIYKYFGVCANTKNIKVLKEIGDTIGFDFEIYKERRHPSKAYCKNCGKEFLQYDKRKKFCSSSCAATYNNKERGERSEDTKIKISKSLRETLDKKQKNYGEESKYKSQTKRGVAKLVEKGIKVYKCEICGISEWEGKPITLQLHHKDGNHFNNNIDNLQVLCPNCHYQTENYCSKNRKEISKHYFCKKCGKELKGIGKTGLCQNCYNNEQILNSKCPDKEVLLSDYQNLHTLSALGRKYDVTIKIIKKWLKKYDIIL